MKRAWEVTNLAAIVAVAGVQRSWLLSDARMPRDLGLFLSQVPPMYAALGSGDPSPALGALLHSGGW